MHDLSETIVAIATPAGRGGVGCVRLSGGRAAEIAGRLFQPASKRAPEIGGRPCFGRFVGTDGSGLDHGYVVLFGDGGSFTGELTAELWSHGSPAVLAELIDAASRAGAVPAGPGEFTYRALRNGRLDLARSEAVRDLVEARTAFQAKVAFAQAEGAVSRRLAPLRETLEEWIARGEAAVEFVDESDVHLPGKEFRSAVAGVRRECAELLRGFERGRVVRDGGTAAIVGRTNAGKSSLFNRLLERDRAIVTEFAGTTRDTLEEELVLDGVPLRLVDTAGLREVRDPVESEGVRRAERARDESDLHVLVLDGTRPADDAEQEALTRADAARTVVVVNKCDLPPADENELPQGALRVSALTGHGMDELRAALRQRLLGSGPVEHPVITDGRHARALEQAAAALDRAAAAGESGLSEELVLEDLREAMRRLGEITGEFDNEALYDRIFSTFCIGK